MVLAAMRDLEAMGCAYGPIVNTQINPS